MKFNAVFVAIASSLLFSCGGGGGSSSTTTNGGSVDQGSTPNLNTLTVSAVYQDACGNETPVSNASLVIHDANFGNEEVISANANGVITYATASDSRDISVVMPTLGDVQGVTPIEMYTVIDQPMSDELNYRIYTNETAQCECQDIEVLATVPQRATDFPSGGFLDDVNGYSMTPSLGAARFRDIEICKPIQGDYNPISIMLTYNDPEEAFGVFINDFSQPQITVQPNIYGSEVLINTDAQNSTQALTFSDGEGLFRNYVFSHEDKPLYVFDHEDKDYFSVSSYYFEDVNTGTGADRAQMLYFNRLDTENNNQTFDLPIEYVDYSELANVVSGVSETYDLSNYQNYDYLAMSVDAFSQGQSVIYWFLTAPTSGTVPSFDNLDTNQFIPDAQVESLVDNARFTIALGGYEGISSYQDFLTNSTPVESRTSEAWNHFHYARLAIVLSNLDLGPLPQLSEVTKSITQGKATVMPVKNKASIL